MKNIKTDIAVIGGGAAGLTAAVTASGAGRKVILIEREMRLGGVLNQCIHSGFGLHYFKEELTGPEYADKLIQKLNNCDAEIFTGSSVTEIRKIPGGHQLTVFSAVHGIFQISARAVILAMGCRERCRGNIGIPGSRCAGVFSAGLAQQLINSDGYLPGKKAVIVGSGDIGLIMARRLMWNNINVECVVEIMPFPAGLSRNIAQCLEDFDIPLYLSHTVTEICGRERVEGVKIAPLVNGRADYTQERFIECDTVLFSVGLVPENELAASCGVKINPVTGGAQVDGNLMCSIEGIFSCGNVLHVHDLVDFVSLEAERAAANAVLFYDNKLVYGAETEITAGTNVRYVVPQSFMPSAGGKFFMRSSIVADNALLEVYDSQNNIILSKRLRYVKPPEMISFELPPVNSDAVSVHLKDLNYEKNQ